MKKVKRKNKSNNKNIFPIVIIGLTVFIIALYIDKPIISLLKYLNEKENQIEQQEEKKKIISFEKINEIEERWEEYYTYYGKEETCKIDIDIIDNYKNYSSTEYIKNSIDLKLKDEYSKIEGKDINGKNWSIFEVVSKYETTTYFVTANENNIYKLEYIESNDNSVNETTNICKKQKEELFNSLRINE